MERKVLLTYNFAHPSMPDAPRKVEEECESDSDSDDSIPHPLDQVASTTLHSIITPKEILYILETISTCSFNILNTNS